MSTITIENFVMQHNKTEVRFDSIVIPKTGIIGVLGKDISLIEEFLLILSGINENHERIKIDEESVYENKTYFQNRVYMDFHNTYTKSISATKIVEHFLEEYHLHVDGAKLHKLIRAFEIRLECNISGVCNFTSIGNTLMNLAIACSIDTQTLISFQPLCFIEAKEQIKQAMLHLVKQYESKRLITSVTDLKYFTDKLNYCLVFTDYNTVKQIDVLREQIVLIQGDARHIYNHIKEEDRLFYTYKNNVFELVCLYHMDAKTKREIENKHTKIKTISIYDIANYL